jgi:hypothetical protein
MLDELLIDDNGTRYIGHVWVEQEGLGRGLRLRWRFAHRGNFVAEFPATAFDTSQTVRARLIEIVRRMSARAEMIRDQYPDYTRYQTREHQALCRRSWAALPSKRCIGLRGHAGPHQCG